MKRKNSWFTALFVSIILLAITGCKNSSQIMFENLGDNDANKNGLSAVVISIGEKVERNIVPEEWTEQKKSTLLYEITSDSTPEGATVTVGDVFTWDEIVEKKAVVYLDPKDWTLTLTAYQQLDTDKFKAKDVSGATEVLKATGVEAKLTTGAKKITFNLKPVTTGTEAVGDVNIQIKFFNEKDIGLNNVEFKILNGSTNVLTTNPPTGTPEKTSFLIGDLSVIGNRGLTSALLAGKVKAGRYQLQVLFTKENGKVINIYEEPILIEGNNLTKAVIEIPENTFGRIPTQPTVLTSSVEWNPPASATNLVTIDLGNGKKAYGQDLELNGEAAPARIHEFYEATFNWNDKSYNEEEFEITLTTSAPAGTIKINKGSGDKDTDTGIAITGTGNAEENVSWVKGSVHPGATSLTLKLPITTKITEATILAKNKILTPADVPNPTKLTKNIGMFLVTYGLKSQFIPDIAVINTGKETKTKNQYYVTAYEWRSDMTTSELISDGPAFPYVSVSNAANNIEYKFNGWKQATAAEYTQKPTLGELTTDTLIAGNSIVVYPIWTLPLTFDVTFPEHSTESKLKVDTKNPKDTVIEPDKNGLIVVEAPTASTGLSIAGTYSNYSFKVFYRDGGTTTEGGTLVPEETIDNAANGIKVENNKLTWDTTNVQGGEYRILVSYDYDPGNGGEKNTIKGNLYVKLKN